MSALAYTKTASVLHWMTAIPLVGSVAAVLKCQSLPKEAKKEKMLWMHRHKSLGLLTGIIVAPRVGYRLFNMAKVSLF